MYKRNLQLLRMQMYQHSMGLSHQGPILLTWFNFKANMDK